MKQGKMLERLAAFAAIVLAAGTPGRASPVYDVVIEGGRVVDPESGTDAVRNIAILNGRIAEIGSARMKGRRTIAARGLIVAPGFVDLHAHGQQLPAARMQAFDGVTTALELESGLLPVAKFYEQAEQEGRPINYGISVSWAYARMAALSGTEPEPDLEWFQDRASSIAWAAMPTQEQLNNILSRIEKGLNEGGVGVGIALGYAPSSSRKEYHEVAKLAARHGVPTFTHVRFMSVTEPQSSFEAYQELVAVAASTGAHMHVAHLNSTSLRDIDSAIDLIAAAQRRGVNITVEAYPYAAASTVIGAAMFKGENWKQRMGGLQESDFEVNGRPLDERSFQSMQSESPETFTVFNYLRPERNAQDQEILDRSLLYPGGAIASDGMPWVHEGRILRGDIWPLPNTAFAHPRSAGTFARFIHEYVYRRQALSLVDALRKTSLIPAQILEASVPDMARKGRLQIGADADIIVFDLEKFRDRATFTAPGRASAGMKFVLVNGELVIAQGELIRSASPGKPIRRAMQASAQVVPDQPGSPPAMLPPGERHEMKEVSNR